MPLREEGAKEEGAGGSKPETFLYSCYQIQYLLVRMPFFESLQVSINLKAIHDHGDFKHATETIEIY